MTHDGELPLSGFSISSVTTISQDLKVVTPAPQKTSTEINFGWDWRAGKAERVFEVLVRLRIEPSQARPYAASVAVVGVFKQIDDKPNISRDEFVRLQAVAILLPYARQYIANLTQSTRFGAYQLPTLNVARLMEGFKMSDATGESGTKNRTKEPGPTKARSRKAAKALSSAPLPPSSQSPSASRD